VTPGEELPGSFSTWGIIAARRLRELFEFADDD
jgi:hypothetical protein